MEFQSFMRGESAKRAIAWEQEKIELRNVHDFDMLEQRRDIENQLIISADMRQKQKTDTQIQSLRNAHEQGQLTEKQMNDEILRIELGLPASQSPLFGKKETTDPVKQYVARLLQEEEEETATTPTGVKTIRAINRKTGERKISYDGGKTWQ